MKYEVSGRVFETKSSTYYEVGIILKKPTTKADLQIELNKFIDRFDLEENGYILACRFSTRKATFKPTFEKQALLTLSENEKSSEIKTGKVKGVKSAAVGVSAKKKDIKKKKDLFAAFLQSHSSAIDDLSDEDGTEAAVADESMMAVDSSSEKNGLDVVD